MSLNNPEDCLRPPITLVLSFLVLSCAHHERPARESANTEPVEVTEEGTWQGQPYVALAFRPLLTDAARESLTPEEARAFGEAMEEMFGETGGRARLWISHPKSSFNSVTEIDTGAAEQWRHMLAEYTQAYGTSNVPLSDSIPDDRFFTAFMLSVKYMPEGVRAGVAELFSSRTAVMAIIAAGVTYLALWGMPEPVLTKSTATLITIGLMVIYGVAEIVNISKAFMRFYDEVGAATTMAELEAAAQRFGEAMGQVGVRIMTMVAGGVASKVAPSASLQNLKSVIKMPATVAAATSDGTVVMVPVVEATTIVVDAAKGTAVLMGVRAVTTTAAATTAMASARTTGDCRPESSKGSAKRHHIATDKNSISDATGGPWTPVFEEIFERAGMALQDPANIILFVGHQGPHPEEYHAEVYRRLGDALGNCQTIADCRKRLVNELDKIAGEICKPGSNFNKLLRKS